MINLIQDSFIKGSKLADTFVETRGETESRLTQRHHSDMKSDNWLAKSIRPLTLLILLILQIFLVTYTTMTGKPVDPFVMGEMGVLMSAAFGFYFNSRRAEKVASKNAEANIQLERLKTKQEHRLTKKYLRAERRAARRAERQQEIEGSK